MSSNSTPTKQELAESLHALLDNYDFTVCRHENTSRGGTLWTLCDDCSESWADDKGGFVPYKEPDFITKARDLLSRMEPEPEFSEKSKKDFEAYIEESYWVFDGRRKGYGRWKNCPQAERDAYKTEMRELAFQVYAAKKLENINAND